MDAQPPLFLLLVETHRTSMHALSPSFTACYPVEETIVDSFFRMNLPKQACTRGVVALLEFDMADMQ